MKGVTYGCFCLRPDGGDTSKWGLTDFYDEEEARLIELLNSGENFEVYGSSRKEIASFSLKKRDEGIICTAFASMDEGWDLINDALWEVAPEHIDQPDSFYEEIMECLDDDWEFSSEASEAITIPRDSDIEKVKEAIDEAWQFADDALKDSYETVKALVMHKVFGEKKEAWLV